MKLRTIKAKAAYIAKHLRKGYDPGDVYFGQFRIGRCDEDRRFWGWASFGAGAGGFKTRAEAIKSLAKFWSGE